MAIKDQLAKIPKAGKGVVDRSVDRVVAVAGAAGASQVPEAFEQYVDHLEGHSAEALRQVGQYEDAASVVGKTLPDYIATHTNSSEPIFQETGEVITEVVERAQYLKDHLEQMINANPLQEVWAAVSGSLDWEIAMETTRSFTPGMPLSLEGAVYATAGALAIGPAIYAGGKALANRAYRRITGKTSTKLPRP